MEYQPRSAWPLDITHFTNAAKKVFGEQFVRASQNLHDKNLCYIAIDGTVFMSYVDFSMVYEGYICTSIESTAKNCLILHYRTKFRDGT